MEGKAPLPNPISLSSLTSTNVRISLQKFLTSNFNSFTILVSNFKAMPSAIPKLLTLNQGLPSKKKKKEDPHNIEVISFHRNASHQTF